MSFDACHLGGVEIKKEKRKNTFGFWLTPLYGLLVIKLCLAFGGLT